jgi:hypothetical protein
MLAKGKMLAICKWQGCMDPCEKLVGYITGEDLKDILKRLWNY